LYGTSYRLNVAEASSVSVGFYLVGIHQMAPPEHTSDKQACYKWSYEARARRQYFGDVLLTVCADDVVDCCVYRRGGRFIGTRYRVSRGQIWMDQVRCRGTEANLAQCQHNNWGRHDCTHSEDVSIQCNVSPPTGSQFIAPSVSMPTRSLSKQLETNYDKNRFEFHCRYICAP